MGGTQPDLFSVQFDSDNDVRIAQIIYDLTFANAPLFFDIAPHNSGGYDFTVLPDVHFPAKISSPVGASHLSADNSPYLVINFTDFQPGETLWFDIDVDGADCSTFTAEQFAGAYIGVLIDPSPAFPGALPCGIAFQFEVRDGEAGAGGGLEVGIPEPATAALLVGGLMLLGCRASGKARRRRAICRRGGSDVDRSTHVRTRAE
jgi:hypothetical protein